MSISLYLQLNKKDINGDSLEDIPLTLDDQANIYANYYKSPQQNSYDDFITRNSDNSGEYGMSSFSISSK